MNKWTLKSLAAAAVGVLALAGQANAAVSYSYTTDQSTYNADAGQAVSVKLYLLETLSGGDSSVIVAHQGVAGAGIQVARSAGGLPGDPSKITGVARNTTDFPTVDAVPPAVSDTNVKWFEGVGASDATGKMPGATTNPLPNALFLGTVTVTAGTLGTTTFNLLPFDAGGGNTLTNDGLDLDFNSANPAYSGASSNPTSFSVTVVPEPAMAGILAMVGAAGTLIRRRRQA